LKNKKVHLLYLFYHILKKIKRGVIINKEFNIRKIAEKVIII